MNEDQRLKAFELRILEKVKEVDCNRQLVSNPVVENVTPKIQYLKKVIAEQHLVLPLFDKVRGKTLALQQYTLSREHCVALAKACENIDDTLIKRIQLENNGITDENFAKLIKALSNLVDFKSIIYK